MAKLIALACVLMVGATASAHAGSYLPGKQNQAIQPVTNRNYGRILPIGDSITAGVGFQGGWRKMLQEALAAEGITFTFVGRSDPRHPMEQPFHEGHSGWTTGQLLDGRPGEMVGNIRTWVTRYKPDTVILMAGTNDRKPDPAAQVQMIADILNVNPKIKVIVGTIPLSKKTGDLLLAETANRNGQFAAIEGFRRTGYPVALANIAEGFDPATMLADVVHPNELGYRHFARVYRDALRSAYGF
jgi:lysophospholipase L1-like esterase